MAGLQGKVFAGYQLAAQIGSGGIAEVYRARALNSQREVVVKIVSAEFARDAAFQQRFAQAVQVAQRLGSHPHVLPLLASGVENGAHYLVTPFVQDGTLRDRLRGGFRLGPGDVAPFLRQLANVLDYAHNLGIVHGNLKPSNIHLYEGRHLLLGDFGLLWDVTKLEMKRKGPAAEAVECFAPEAFAGRLSPASDIYSLGAVLFMMLTGRAPFTGKTPADVYNAHVRQSVPLLEQVDSKLPPALRALNPVISRAMAKRPEERFPSAGIMVQVVEAAVQPGGAARASAASGGQMGPLGQMGQMGQMGPLGQMGAFAPGVMPAPLSAPLQPLDFPPLPSSEEATGLMDEGRIAAHLDDPAQPPMRPLSAGPTPYPMPGPMPGQASGQVPGSMPSQMTGGPQPFPGQPYPAQPFPGQMPPQPFPMPGPMPAPMPGPMDAQAPQQGQQSYVPGLGPIPLGGGPLDPGHDAARAAKGYSATELNLPRLTHVELGPLSPDLDQHLQARMEAAPAVGGTQVVAAPVVTPAAPPPTEAPEEEWDESQAYSAVQRAYDDSRESQAMESQAWPSEYSEYSAAYAAPRPEWDYTDERSAPVSARRPVSRRRGGWDEDEYPERGRPRGGSRGGERGRRGSRRDDDDDDDDRYGQNYRQDYGRRSRRRDDYDDEYDDDYEPRGGGWTRGLLIALIPLLLLTLSGVAVMRPDLCPVSACQKVSDKVHQLVPALGGGADGGSPSSADALSASPAQIQLSTTVNTPVSATLKLTNSGTGDVAWQGSTTIAWVTLAPANGTIPAGGNATVTVTANPSGISPATYTTAISVKAGGSTISVPLQVTVSGS